MAILKNTTIEDTGALLLPRGTTAQRPSSPDNGMTRFNSNFNCVEAWDGSYWRYMPDIVRDNIALYVDAGEPASYSIGGTSWNDLSMFSNNATIVNGASFSSDGGGSLNFDGVNDYATITNSNSLDIPNQVSVEAWVNYAAQGGTNSYSVICVKGYPWNWLLEDQGGKFNFRISTTDNSDSNLDSGYSHGYNIWNHVVATYNGSTQNIYVNGEAIASKNMTGTLNTSSTNIKIGSYTTTTFHLTGKISQVRVYNVALSLNQIRTNYNATRYRYF
jgi:hypothetical protein